MKGSVSGSKFRTVAQPSHMKIKNSAVHLKSFPMPTIQGIIDKSLGNTTKPKARQYKFVN